MGKKLGLDIFFLKKLKKYLMKEELTSEEKKALINRIRNEKKPGAFILLNEKEFEFIKTKEFFDQQAGA